MSPVLVPLKRKMWIGIHSCDSLFEGCASVNDLRLLSAALKWDIPAGMAVLNLDRHKSHVYAKPGMPADVTGAESALSWPRLMGSPGLLMRACDGGAEFALIEVLWAPGQTSMAALHRDLILAASVDKD